MTSEDTQILEQALVHLHSWSSGDLRFDDHLRSIRYVFAPDGRIVAPVMVAMLQAVETVLHVPVADESAMEVLVTAVEFEESGPHGALADRWRIYHGDPPDVRWAIMDLDLARFHGMVIDGEGLQDGNPLAALEPALCGELNRDHQRGVQATIQRLLDVQAEDPRVVGIDPRGIDVRTRFDVLRLNVEAEVGDPDTARQTVLDLFAGTPRDQ